MADFAYLKITSVLVKRTIQHYLCHAAIYYLHLDIDLMYCWLYTQKAVILWMLEPAERDAAILRDALQGLGTNDIALIEIISSRSTSQLEAIQRAYTSMYKRNLHADIASDTSGDYRTVCSSY